MRHAIAPGTGDPANFEIGDCATQRNLDARGRAQSRRLGAALADRGIAFDRVLTSQWCRCRETAELVNAGPVEGFPVLNSFFAERRANGPRQTAELRAFLAEKPAGERVLLVTHYVNISALTGRAVRSGELLVLDVGPEGYQGVAGEILLDP